MSLPAGERLHESAGAFASDLSDVLWRYQPELWVHGHVHSAADYRVGNTRVLCNPRGYRRPDWAEKTGWREELVVEV
jgi:Predicted phosphoesterases, related to the Icc protein